MSTQTIKERPLVHGLGDDKSANWLKVQWSKLLSQKKQLMLGGGALAIIAIAAFYFWGNQSAAAQYMTAKIERGNLRNTVTATGTLQAVTTVQVGSQASGTISALYADFNSVVKKGQVVAQLDPAVSNDVLGISELIATLLPVGATVVTLQLRSLRMGRIRWPPPA